MNVYLSLILSIASVIFYNLFGRAFSPLIFKGDEKKLERFVINTATGMGMMSVLYFFTCALHITFLFAIIAAFTVICISVIKNRPHISLKMNTTQPSLDILYYIFFGIMGILTLIAALLPATMADWDSLAYHLSVPKMFLKHGGFYYINFMSHSNFPLLQEMLYLPGLAAGSVVLAKLHHFWFGVLMVMACGMTASRHFCKKSTFPAMAAIATMPIVVWEATTAYVDLTVSLYTILCVYFVLLYVENNDRRSIIGAAIMAGFAASVKFTGCTLIPLVIIWLCADRLFWKNRDTKWKDIGIFGLISIVLCSIWYIKTWIFTGNPVYPFFYSIFGGKDWSANLASSYAIQQAKFGYGHNLISLIRLPYDMMVNSQLFYDTPGLYIGPLFMLSVPIFLLGRYKNKKLAQIFAFFLIETVIWFTLTQQSRYMIPEFCLLAIISASIMCMAKIKILKGIYISIFILTAIFSVTTISPFDCESYDILRGKIDTHKYLMERVDVYAPAYYINKATKKDAKIALYGDTRGFFIDRNYVWADPGHNKLYSQNFNTLGSLTQLWKREKIDYISVNFKFFPAEKDATGTAALIYQAINNHILEETYPPVSGIGIYKINWKKNL